jgi:predicted nucleic acid-binding protein
LRYSLVPLSSLADDAMVIGDNNVELARPSEGEDSAESSTEHSRPGLLDGTAHATILLMLRVVLDTSVLVAALRSRRGASFELISRLGTGTFEVAVSVPLVLEYEGALLRHVAASPFTESDVWTLIDYICDVAVQQEVFFLWRPFLRDPGDDLVLELAVAARCAAIVTHNVRDFGGAERFGVGVLRPGRFLQQLRGQTWVP